MTRSAPGTAARRVTAAKSGAFVLQVEIAGRPGSDEERLRGRVEHLASGTEAHVGSVDELLAFIRARTARTERNER